MISQLELESSTEKLITEYLISKGYSNVIDYVDQSTTPIADGERVLQVGTSVEYSKRLTSLFPPRLSDQVTGLSFWASVGEKKIDRLENNILILNQKIYQENDRYGATPNYSNLISMQAQATDYIREHLYEIMNKVPVCH